MILLSQSSSTTISKQSAQYTYYHVKHFIFELIY